ncbi:hypothetical protein GCM10009557_31890 [Virgisporangium ochraceum]|uniref:Uncharacterized protein n=1 Tax=Virgisporangium ochraceum TaxID=65505 RepID=A0A8J4A736_9ACTN|nr:hypothetical protein [Virgisporangium ochraceum]GIJ75090.1 hypothetical protein Voc01_100070 [Virgisporangium ochraceum]
MTVHIGELHTDIRTPPPTVNRSDDRPPAPADEQVADIRQRADWAAARVAAEGFDD